MRPWSSQDEYVRLFCTGVVLFSSNADRRLVNLVSWEIMKHVTVADSGFFVRSFQKGVSNKTYLLVKVLLPTFDKGLW